MATPIFVDSGRSVDTGSGVLADFSDAKRTINAAVDAVDDGGTIVLRDSRVHILSAVKGVSKSITILSEAEYIGSTPMSESVPLDDWPCIVNGLGAPYYLVCNTARTLIVRGIRWTNFGNRPFYKRGTGNVSIIRCAMDGNTTDGSLGSTGAGFYCCNYNADVPGVITIENSIFKNNHTPTIGAGVGITHATTVNITDSVFEDNLCTYTAGATGGAGCHIGNQTAGLTTVATVSRCAFRRNLAGSPTGANYANGGGLRFRGETNATTPVTGTVLDCEFTENQAEYGGGCYYGGYAAGTVRRSKFIRNSADYDGGGFYRGGALHTDMDYCEFTENQAHNPNGVDGGGGAIFVLGGSGKIDCNNTTFRNNTSTGYGDSAYCREVDDPNLTVKSNFVNCVFIGSPGGRAHIYGHNGNAVDIIDHCQIALSDISDAGAIVTNRHDAGSSAIGVSISGLHGDTDPAVDVNGNIVCFEPPDIGATQSQDRVITEDDYSPTGTSVRRGAHITIRANGDIDLSGLSETSGMIRVDFVGYIRSLTHLPGITVQRQSTLKGGGPAMLIL